MWKEHVRLDISETVPLRWWKQKDANVYQRTGQDNYNSQASRRWDFVE